MSPTAHELVARVIDAVDLVIDFATLGEYGLEEMPTDGPGCEGTGRRRATPATPRVHSPTGWEAFAPARHGSI